LSFVETAMPMKPAAQAEFCRLRQNIARIEGRLLGGERPALDSTFSTAATGFGPRQRRQRLRLGLASLDALLGGGLPLEALHEVRSSESRDGGAASGFALALVTRLVEAGDASSILWISQADARREAGFLYAPGLVRLGLDPSRVVEVAARTQNEALWAFEAALSCNGLGAAICELRQASLDLSATRRCALRARETGITGFLLRLGSHAEPSAAELRFRVASLPAGAIGRFPAGIGRMAWRLALEKNRSGPTGAFSLEWNAYERSFVERGEGKRHADPQPLPAASSYRPAHQGGAEIGLAAFRRAS
jgi:protein ImuA